MSSDPARDLIDAHELMASLTATRAEARLRHDTVTADACTMQIATAFDDYCTARAILTARQQDPRRPGAPATFD